MRILNGLGRFGTISLLAAAAALSACQTTSGAGSETKIIGSDFRSTIDPSVTSGDPRLANVAKELAGIWNGSANGAGTGGVKITLAIESVTKGLSNNTLKAKGYTASERSNGRGRPTDIDVEVTNGGYSILFDAASGRVEAHSISKPGAMEGQVITGRGRADLTLTKASS
ncbi:hypothetical protein [Azospirillum sp.]|uniref:hypothetical protein n=1 Tax=Azospirillum sp. TaxID=34012 RepID=UPI003D72A826